MHVLVVDDDPLFRHLLLRYLAPLGHDATGAADAEGAWERLRNGRVNVVICDWEMPGASGVDLCRRIRASDLGRYVYVVLLTARAGRDSLIEGIEAGADDFMTKPLDAAELRVRLRSAERVLRLEADLAERNARLEEAQGVIAQDLQAASTLQRSLLPARPDFPPGYTCAWLFEPCAVVGGDVFNYAQIDDDHLALYLLDVAGHGIPAAMLSMMVSKLLRPDMLLAPVPGLIETALQPPRLLRRLNERFQEEHNAMQYFTMLYGTLQLSDGTVTLGQAGHPPALHVTAGGARFVGRGGFPIGMLPGLTYEADDVHLSPGDRLVLYSDGVVECRAPDGEPFGAQRLADWFERRRDRPLRACTDALTATLVEWRGGTEFDDDLTLFAVERT